MTATTRSSLVSPELSVLYVYTDGAPDELCAQLSANLHAEDQLRASRFVYAKDRLLFAAGRALVHRKLRSLGTEPPGGFRFITTAEGKPALMRSAGFPRVGFNISHCAGVVAAAFAREREIGVDVEPTTNAPDCLELAQLYFAPAEINLLEGLPETERRERFTSIWTLKEAYMKARGLGLSAPLREFAFRLDPPAIDFSPRHPGHCDKWFLYAHRLSSGHHLALAAEKQEGEQLTLKVERLDLRELLVP